MASISNTKNTQVTHIISFVSAVARVFYDSSSWAETNNIRLNHSTEPIYKPYYVRRGGRVSDLDDFAYECLRQVREGSRRNKFLIMATTSPIYI